jgi:hypothetical protein
LGENLSPNRGELNRSCTDEISDRDSLDRVMVFGPTHLRRILQSYFVYYHEHRLHRSLEHNSPMPRAMEPPDQGQIIEFPSVGGLHHRYGRRAA